ncbi:MAG: MiaB/RimO family radical SAM methylthiotransferase [Candidatus Wallbacteria bacterium]|nr:MiaB/RimO family radical SAM methylthiotransferase [Candidatus Wallbacteria bacterium]
MKFHLHAFGCKVNQYEGELIREELSRLGYQSTGFSEAELLIVKSCVVTSESECKVARLVKSARNSGKSVWLVGCISENLRARLSNYSVEYFETAAFRDKFGITASRISGFASHTRAFVKIQDGCDSFCAYCIVPKLRPALESKVMTEAVSEVENLVKNGFREIVLTGVHLGKYGFDLGEPRYLPELIDRISGIEDLLRLRLGSLHPQEITPALIKAFYDHKLMPHLHISMQSGSDRVLKLMNRRYTAADILRVVSELQNVPGMEITGDVIVGFPGETDRDFKETMAVVEAGEFAYLHVFPFSFREGTKAMDLKESALSRQVMGERIRLITSLRDTLFESRRRRYLGRSLPVLVEESKKGLNTGFSENYLKICFSGQVRRNTVAMVSVSEFRMPVLYGEMK